MRNTHPRPKKGLREIFPLKRIVTSEKGGYFLFDRSLKEVVLLI